MTSDERIIEYLRARGRERPPDGFVSSVMAAIDAAPKPRSRFSGYVPPFAAAAAVAVIALVALLLGPGRDVGPAPSDAPSAMPEAATLGELEAAVTMATERLAGAASVQGRHTFTVEDYLASATWFDWRPGGDQVVITRTDVDVSAPWWTDPDGEPLTVGERVETTIRVLIGDAFYRTEDGAWIATHRVDAPRGPLTWGIGILSGEIPAVPVVDSRGEVAVTRRDEADGGAVWVLDMTGDEARGRTEWRIGPDGILVSYAIEGDYAELAGSLDFGEASSRAELAFTPVVDPEPIPTPDPADAPDPAAFGLPEDFPLGDDAATIDHRADVTPTK